MEFIPLCVSSALRVGNKSDIIVDVVGVLFFVAAFMVGPGRGAEEEEDGATSSHQPPRCLIEIEGAWFLKRQTS